MGSSSDSFTSTMRTSAIAKSAIRSADFASIEASKTRTIRFGSMEQHIGTPQITYFQIGRPAYTEG